MAVNHSLTMPLPSIGRPNANKREHRMDANLIERIRERAYLIWCAIGRPDGEADQHWLAAEREILQPAKAATPAKRTVAKKAKGLLGSRPAAKAAAATLN
jgi:DUF2934 family protein